jgi:hypothetical protein
MRAALLLPALFVLGHTLIEPYIPPNPITIIKELKKSTVVLMEAKVYLRGSKDSEWRELQRASGAADDQSEEYLQEERDIKIELTGIHSKDRTWQSLVGHALDNYATKNAQFGSRVNFFWTSLEQGYHMFTFRVFSESMSPGEELGLELALYEGRPEDPSIYSHVDSQMKYKRGRLVQCINMSRDIVELQNLDQQDEEEFARISNSIFKIIVFSVFLKVVVFTGSFFYINKKIHDFYVSKKIIT